MSEKSKHEELDLSVKSLDTIRNEILDTLLFTISIFALLPLAASLNRIAEIGWQGIMYFHLISYLVVCTTTILHRRLRYRYKATVLISLCFLIGCFATANMGLIGSGVLYMVFSIILATMFFGKRYSIFLITSGLLLLVVVAYGVKQNWIVFNFSIETAALSFSSWISRISAFALFSTILIFSLGRLINYLVDSSENLKERTLELNKINAKLRQEISEKKQAEEALRESELKYKTLTENSIAGIFIHQDDKYVYVNEKFAEMHGYTPEELFGINHYDLIHPDQRELIQQRAYKRLEGEPVPKQYEIKRLHKNEQDVWHEIMVGDPINYEGKPAIMGHEIDITERKQAEQRLQASEERYRGLVNTMQDIVHSVSADGTILFIGPQIERYGFTVEEMVSQPFADFIHPEDRDAVLRDIQHTLATAEQMVATFRINAKDGSVVWFEETGQEVRDTTGNIVSISGILRDVTEKKLAEEALRDSERKLHAIFDHHYQLTGLIDTEGRLLAANRTALRFAGAEESEVIGRYFWHGPWWDLSQRSELRHAVERAVSGAFVRFETTHPTADGEIRDIDFSLSPVRDDDGNVIYVVPEGRDITEIRRTEEERAKLQVQLNQAQKMEAVGRLAGGVAHDFNNMLTVILGNVELALEDESIRDPIREWLQQAHNAAKRSADLTRQLLAFARKQTVAPKVLDLNETVEGMLKMLRRLIGEDIDLAWMPGRDVWPIKMDPGQIDQLLANLCVNSQDAIEGVGKITIETGNARLDQAYCDAHTGFVPGDFVRLAVSDDGCGMDADTRAKIFEPFFTTKGEREGTGLGLATVYGIVKQNEAFINVYSEPEHGTTFSIYFPRHGTGPGQNQPEESEKTIPIGHETILLVEDEPALLQLTTVMLESLGYRVQTAGSPKEALRLARNHAGEINLLITDVVMPEMNGHELAGQLEQTLPELKRLFMSGYTENVITHQGVLEEGVRFIQKPFTRQGLATMVREALDAG